MDRYTKAFVVASLVYFFLAAVLGVFLGAAEPAGWVPFAHVHFNLLGFMSMMIYGGGDCILTRWRGTVEVLVANGFASLENPEHREQVKKIPITLRMACQRHNVDLEPMVAKLSAAAGGAMQAATAGAGLRTGTSGGDGRKGGLSRGEPIRGENILGDILAIYPETVKGV